MSVNVDEVRALAHAFARQLEYLREFRGVFYVGAAPMPVGDGADEVELESELDEVEQHEPVPTQSAPHEPAASEVAPQPATREPMSPQSTRAAAATEHSRPRRQSPQSNPRSPSLASAEQWSAAEKLRYLRERNVGDCQRCPLARSRRNIVFGVGNPEADLMFVGEAPGAEEDRLGEPFVGAAGRRLDQWLERFGLRRADVYIANVLKCRPPGNRNPQTQEIERCSPFLHAQIRAVEPKVLIALGRFAGCLLLGRELNLRQMRGQVHRYREPKSGVEIPLLVTYHPAYVLRSEQQPPGARGQPDRAGAIKSEEEKVLADFSRALELL